MPVIAVARLTHTVNVRDLGLLFLGSEHGGRKHRTLTFLPIGFSGCGFSAQCSCALCFSIEARGDTRVTWDLLFLGSYHLQVSDEGGHQISTHKLFHVLLVVDRNRPHRGALADCLQTLTYEACVSS